MTHQLHLFAALMVSLLIADGVQSISTLTTRNQGVNKSDSSILPPSHEEFTSRTSIPLPPSFAETKDGHTNTDLDLEALEERVHELVNFEREKKKIAPLSFQPRLVELARSHSVDMAFRNYVDHINPEGKDPTERAIDAKFECNVKSYKGVYPTGIGENILMSYLYENIEIVTTNGVEERTYNWKSFEDMAEEIVKNWMGSKGHRENILRKDYHYEGIGIATNLNSQIFVTQNFC